MTPDHQRHQKAAGGPLAPGIADARRGSVPSAAYRSLIPAYALLGFSIVVFTISLTIMIHRLVVRGDEASVQPTGATGPVAGGEPVVDGNPAGSGSSPAHTEENRAGTPDQGVTEGESRVTLRTEALEDAQAPAPQPVAPLVDGDAAEAPQPGMLRLRSLPRAAAYVDGRPVGLTPLTLELRPGSPARVVLVASGRKIYRKTVRSSRKGDAELMVRLKLAKYPRYGGSRRGVLKVRCRPEDPRRVFLNGSDSGYSCPKVAYYLRPGRYRVGLQQPVSGRTATMRVRVRSRRITVVRPPYKPHKKSSSRR